MWVLECDGNILDGKRKWLRPGKAYTVGRRATVETVIGVAHKSVSAKHVRITVDVPKKGDASKLLQGSKIKIEDLHSKIGTVLDGVKIKGETRTISGERHMLNFGSYPHPFWIKWVPVVLSVSFSPKELNSGKDILADLRNQIEHAGVKTVSEFIVGRTTHVVSSVRNTTIALEGLINGKPLVSMDFVDALADMCRPRSSSDPDGVCKLEQDFDASFPKVEDFLPPPSEDQVIDPQLFSPDPRRSSIFQGITFVFMDIKQYNRMLGVVTNGEGKAEHYHLKAHETEPKSIADHIRKLSGPAQTRRSLTSTSKKVIVVRFRAKGADDLVWLNWFQDAAQKELNQRFVDPRDFLPAILSCDATTFPTTLEEEVTESRPLESPPTATLPEERPRRRISVDVVQVPSSPPEPTLAPVVIHAPPPVVEAIIEDSHPDIAAPDESPTPPKIHETVVADPESIAPQTRVRRPRRAITSQFTGFDDGFNPQSYTTAHSKQTQPKDHAATHEDDSLFLHSQDSEPPQAAQHGKKRKLDVVAEEEEDDREMPDSDSEVEDSQAMLDNLLPAAREMKKRKIVQEKEDAARPAVPPPAAPPEDDHAPSSKRTSPRKGKRFLSTEDQQLHDHVRAQAKKRRAAIDDKLDHEREDLRTGLDEMRLGTLPEVITYTLKPRHRVGLRAEDTQPPPHHSTRASASAQDPKGKAAMYGPSGSRWDPAWNGRKNFKRFRPQTGLLSDGTSNRRLHSRIIVPLVEAERRNYGLQDPDWLARVEEKRLERQRRLGDLPGAGSAAGAGGLDSFERGSSGGGSGSGSRLGSGRGSGPGGSGGRNAGLGIEEELRAEDERAARDEQDAERVLEGRVPAAKLRGALLPAEDADGPELVTLPPGGTADTVGRSQTWTAVNSAAGRKRPAGSTAGSEAGGATTAKRQRVLKGKGKEKVVAVVDDGSESSEGELRFRLIRRGG